MHNIVNWTSGCKVLKRFKRDFIRKIDVSLFFMQVDDIQEGKDHSAAIRPRGFPELVKTLFISGSLLRTRTHLKLFYGSFSVC
ncbi:uncharacterized protein [Euwallacea fornicatus]|uniref:uncharacterized protein isoform X2 n=1 Tax=Euwallacea fornicatus TaxID=995702 RepID=UPI00338E0F66